MNDDAHTNISKIYSRVTMYKSCQSPIRHTMLSSVKRHIKIAHLMKPPSLLIAGLQDDWNCSEEKEKKYC